MQLDRRSFTALGAASLLTTPASGLVSRTNGSWRAGAAMPYAVQEIYPALVDDKIYVVGGLSPEAPEAFQNISNRTIIYDIPTDSWTDGPDFPEARHHPNCIGYEGKLYAMSGFSADNGGRWSIRQTLHVFDPDRPEDGWSELEPMPAHQAEAVLFARDGFLHLVSGRKPSGRSNANWQDHSDTNAHQVYNLQTGEWTTSAPCPVARNSASGARIDDQFYLVGGRTVTGGNRDNLDVFTPPIPGTPPSGPPWQSLDPMPQGQGGLAAASVNGRLYAFGGEYFGPGGGGVYPEVWEFNPETGHWNEQSPMPTPRHGLGAIAYNGEIYVIGGAAEAGGAATSRAVEIFRP